MQKEKSSLKVFAAAEGQEIQLTAPNKHTQHLAEEQLATNALSTSALSEQSVLIYIADADSASTLTEAVQTKGINATFIKNIEELKKRALTEKPALILIEHHPSLINGIDACRAIRQAMHQDKTVPIILIAKKEEKVDGDAGVTDWLITPFTTSYARSRINAWILRVACRWIRAPIPANEEQRLAALHNLMILDTESEERFNRITRIAAALLDVPIALISFIDRDRQWFKSSYGASVKETPREVSFCSHAVYSQAPLIVVDTFQDDRFAENPAVTNDPPIRFYAGYPLILNDGSCVGTLCCLDIRPRVLQEKDLRLLQDLRDITINELYTRANENHSITSASHKPD